MAIESLRITKLAPSARLSDRYLTVQIKDAPDPDQTDSFGRLCALVEIEGSWQSNAQIGQTIINTLSRQYYRGTHAHALANFEVALKRVNETLKQLTQTGSTDWIGHLHAAMVVVVGSEIHIATTGHVYSTLFRDHKATPMSDYPSDQTTTPSTIFGTLLSGVIEPGDQLIIASSGIHKLCSQKELEQLIGEPHEDVAGQLAALLQTKRGTWVHALLIDAPSTPSGEHPPAATTITIDSSATNWKTATATLIARTQRFLKPLGAWFSEASTTAKTTTSTKLWPGGKARLNQARAWSTNQLAQITSKTLPAVQTHAQTLQTRLTSLIRPSNTTPPPVDDAEQKAPATSATTATPPQVENLIGRSVYAIRDYSSVAKTPIAEAPTVTDYQQPITKQPHPLLGLRKLTLPTWPKLLAAIEWRSILFGLLALILFIILATNIRVITSQRQTEQSKQELLTQLSALQDKLEEARLARIFNQPEKAAEALDAVLAGLPALTSSSVKEGALLLEEKAQGELDELTNTTRLSERKTIATLPGSTRFAQSGNLILATTDQGALTRIELDSGKTTPLPVPSNQSVVSLAAYDNQAGIVVQTDGPASYVLTPGQEQLQPLTTTGEWKAGSALTTFFGNLYTLSADDTQIWKYSSTQAGFGKPEAYIADATSLGSALDLAIDGQVYVLRTDGTALRLNRGKADQFTLAELPKPTSRLADPKQLVTTKDSNRLYVLDGGRIVSFDKTGAFQIQYAFKGLGSIQSFTIDEGKKIFTILANNTLYTVQF